MIKLAHNGGNLNLKDQPLSGRPVTETHNFNWKMSTTFFEIIEEFLRLP